MEEGSGHAVLAYDIVDHPDGRADVLVHDSNVPFEEAELSINGLLHQDRTVRQSVIRISADRSSWELDMGSGTWRGGDKTLFAFGREVIGEDPTLPDLTGLRHTLSTVLFGSADGAVVSTGAEDYLPSLDAAALPALGGAVSGTSHTVRGVKAGRYRQAILRAGTIATVDAPTAAGVEDSVRAVTGGLAFEGEAPRAGDHARRRLRGRFGEDRRQDLGREREAGRHAARVRQRGRSDDVLVQAPHVVARRSLDVRVGAGASCRGRDRDRVAGRPPASALEVRQGAHAHADQPCAGAEGEDRVGAGPRRQGHGQGPRLRPLRPGQRRARPARGQGPQGDSDRARGQRHPVLQLGRLDPQGQEGRRARPARRGRHDRPRNQ